MSTPSPVGTRDFCAVPATRNRRETRITTPGENGERLVGWIFRRRDGSFALAGCWDELVVPSWSTAYADFDSAFAALGAWATRQRASRPTPRVTGRVVYGDARDDAEPEF